MALGSDLKTERRVNSVNRSTELLARRRPSRLSVQRDSLWLGVRVPAGVSRKLFRFVPSGLVLSGILSTACVTSGEGEAMRAETAKLAGRLDEMESRYAEAIRDMERLRTVVDEANALLKRNSADLGARVEQQEQDFRKLRGLLAEIQHLTESIEKSQSEGLADLTARVAVLDANQQKLIDKVAPTMPDDKEALWVAAQERLTAGQREEARRFFKSFVTRFPQDPRAATGRLAIGKAYALDGKHSLAAGQYQKVLSDYAKSAAVPEATFELGRSFLELKFCADARALFIDVARRFKRSPFAAKARQQAAGVKRLLGDPTRCTS